MALFTLSSSRSFVAPMVISVVVGVGSGVAFHGLLDSRLWTAALVGIGVTVLSWSLPLILRLLMAVIGWAARSTSNLLGYVLQRLRRSARALSRPHRWRSTRQSLLTLRRAARWVERFAAMSPEERGKFRLGVFETRLLLLAIMLIGVGSLFLCLKSIGNEAALSWSLFALATCLTLGAYVIAWQWCRPDGLGRLLATAFAAVPFNAGGNFVAAGAMGAFNSNHELKAIERALLGNDGLLFKVAGLQDTLDKYRQDVANALKKAGEIALDEGKKTRSEMEKGFTDLGNAITVIQRPQVVLGSTGEKTSLDVTPLLLQAKETLKQGRTPRDRTLGAIVEWRIRSDDGTFDHPGLVAQAKSELAMWEAALAHSKSSQESPTPAEREEYLKCSLSISTMARDWRGELNALRDLIALRPSVDDVLRFSRLTHSLDHVLAPVWTYHEEAVRQLDELIESSRVKNGIQLSERDWNLSVYFYRKAKLGHLHVLQRDVREVTATLEGMIAALSSDKANVELSGLDENGRFRSNDFLLRDLLGSFVSLLPNGREQSDRVISLAIDHVELIARTPDKSVTRPMVRLYLLLEDLLRLATAMPCDARSKAIVVLDEVDKVVGNRAENYEFVTFGVSALRASKAVCDGKIDEARESIERMRALRIGSGDPSSQFFWTIYHLLIAIGDHSEASRMLSDSVARDAIPTNQSAMAALLYLDSVLVTGDVQSAKSVLDRLDKAFEQRRPQWDRLPEFSRFKSQFLSMAGMPSAALKLAEQYRRECIVREGRQSSEAQRSALVIISIHVANEQPGLALTAIDELELMPLTAPTAKVRFYSRCFLASSLMSLGQLRSASEAIRNAESMVDDWPHLRESQESHSWSSHLRRQVASVVAASSSFADQKELAEHIQTMGPARAAAGIDATPMADRGMLLLLSDDLAGAKEALLSASRCREGARIGDALRLSRERWMLVEVYARSGEGPKAIELARELLEIQQRQPLKLPSKVAEATGLLAMARAACGLHAEALASRREADGLFAAIEAPFPARLDDMRRKAWTLRHLAAPLNQPELRREADEIDARAASMIAEAKLR